MDFLYIEALAPGADHGKGTRGLGVLFHSWTRNVPESSHNASPQSCNLANSIVKVMDRGHAEQTSDKAEPTVPPTFLSSPVAQKKVRSRQGPSFPTLSPAASVSPSYLPLRGKVMLFVEDKRCSERLCTYQT